MNMALTERTGRAICWLLAIFDLALGVTATFFPAVYCALLHPDLPAPDNPQDFVVRTGVLWLAFCVLQLCGALSRSPAKWFFCIAMLRLMEGPADVAYGILARGASLLSHTLILSAPFANGLVGTMLLIISRRIRASGG